MLREELMFEATMFGLHCFVAVYLFVVLIGCKRNPGPMTYDVGFASHCFNSASFLLLLHA